MNPKNKVAKAIQRGFVHIVVAVILVTLFAYAAITMPFQRKPKRRN